MKKVLYLHGLESGQGGSKVDYLANNCYVHAPEMDYTRKDIFPYLAQMVEDFNPDLIIGSSMGAWISLTQFKYFKTQIKGFLGIGSAPEFLERLMWNKFSESKKKEIKKNGIIYLKHGNYEYPITYQLIKDGRKNKVLHKKIYQNINVTMVHGEKDESVPVSYSKKVLKVFKNSKKKLVIVKNGDHSLSSPKWLKLLKTELKLIIN